MVHRTASIYMKKLIEHVFHGVDGESVEYLTQKESALVKRKYKSAATKLMKEITEREYKHFLYCYDERDGMDKIRRVHIYTVAQALTDDEYSRISDKLKKNGSVYALHTFA